MRPPALVPPHMPLAEAARIAKKHGFVLRQVRHEGKLRIAMVRPDATDVPTSPPPTEPGKPHAQSSETPGLPGAGATRHGPEN
jgi:hypothetical protein